MDQRIGEYTRFLSSSQLIRYRQTGDRVSGFFYLLDESLKVFGSYPASCDAASSLPCLSESALVRGENSIELPVSFDETIDNFYYERYVGSLTQPRNNLSNIGLFRQLYYWIRPCLPVSVRKHFQRIALKNWRTVSFPAWPIDTTVDEVVKRYFWLYLTYSGERSVPFIWFWPKGYRCACIMTHDVETEKGFQYIPELIKMDSDHSIHSSFAIVPEERYRVDLNMLRSIRDNGFEVCVHGLNHDGRLFDNYEIFKRRAEKINQYADQFESVGFRSPVMYHNAAWYHHLRFEYDSSIPNSAHLDPQFGGCCTVMPFFVTPTMVELPHTTTQDYSLFNILKDYSIELWKRQITKIVENHGLLTFIVHPDYILAKKERDIYLQLLRYLSDVRQREAIWFALPREVCQWWKRRNRTSIVSSDGQLSLQGPAADEAVIAYIRLRDNQVVYTFDPT